MAKSGKMHFPLGRTTHVVMALVSIVLCFLAYIYWKDDLFKDKATGLSTVGIFATFYGVLFTIIEVLRTKAAAVAASESAGQAMKRVEALYDIRNATECQTLIENALDQLARQGVVSPSALGRIVKLYVAEFSQVYESDASPHRERINIVSSYEYADGAHNFRQSKGLSRLQGVLVSMIADLAMSSSNRVHEERLS